MVSNGMPNDPQPADPTLHNLRQPNHRFPGLRHIGNRRPPTRSPAKPLPKQPPGVRPPTSLVQAVLPARRQPLPFVFPDSDRGSRGLARQPPQPQTARNTHAPTSSCRTPIRYPRWGVGRARQPPPTHLPAHRVRASLVGARWWDGARSLRTTPRTPAPTTTVIPAKCRHAGPRSGTHGGAQDGRGNHRPHTCQHTA